MGRRGSSGATTPSSPPLDTLVDQSLLSELRALDVELFDPPVAPPRVPVPSSRDPQRLTLGFADRRARARFLARCTTEVAERCRGGASAACALAVARFDDGDDGGNGRRGAAAPPNNQQQQQQQQPTAKRRKTSRRPWWARMLLLPGPRNDDDDDENDSSCRRRRRCEAEAARACRDHARSFCRALVEDADGD